MYFIKNGTRSVPEPNILKTKTPKYPKRKNGVGSTEIKRVNIMKITPKQKITFLKILELTIIIIFSFTLQIIPVVYLFVNFLKWERQVRVNLPVLISICKLFVHLTLLHNLINGNKIQTYYMKRLSPEQNEKVTAALELLVEETTTFDKINKVCTLLKGIHPTVDKHIKTATNIVDKLSKIQEGDVISLTLEKLPDNNKKEKERKKLLLLFLKNWRGLESEVKRISDLQKQDSGNANSVQNAIKMGKVLGVMKGPLGLITIAAAGIVAVSSLLNSKAVAVTVKNAGCEPFTPGLQTAINLPGLKLPNHAIPNGGNGLVTIPGIDLTVDESQMGTVNLKAIGFSQSFSMPDDIQDVVYDGVSLRGKETTIKLGGSKTHEVIIRCSE